MDRPAPCSPVSQPHDYNWEFEEVRDLITVWGVEKVQSQLQKRHYNRHIYTSITQQMKAPGHNRDWKQCRAKTKLMKSQFSQVQDANKCFWA